MAIRDGTIAPTINLDVADPECDLDYVPLRSRRTNVDAALCNCIGFGSKNSAIVLRKV
jgi:3-oxoacyl-[acyl-carrier-protein] synthase II